MDINDIASKFYEFLGSSSIFSDDLYGEEVYASLGLVNIALSMFIVLMYYFILNRPKFNSLGYWSVFLIVNFIIALVIGILYPREVFTKLGLDYGFLEYFILGLKNALLATLLFVIWTYVFKWFRSHCQGTPKLFFGKF